MMIQYMNHVIGSVCSDIEPFYFGCHGENIHVGM